MVKSNASEHMFKFSTKLFAWKNHVEKDGYSSFYLRVYISYKGSSKLDYFKLSFEWPIDFDNALLPSRFKGDPDVNYFNMIILTERSKFNEIAKT